MSPQLYPTPPNPTDNNSSSSILNQSSTSSSSTLYRNRWPLLFTAYLVLGGIPSIPSVQRQLNPRTAGLLRTGSLMAVVFGTLGLTAYDVLGTEMSRREINKVGVNASASADRGEFVSDSFETRDVGDDQLSERELLEKREKIQREGLQRD